MTHDKKQQGSEAGEPQKRKKPYRRPEILYREPLEAMAALCTPVPAAKAVPGPGSCNLAQRS